MARREIIETIDDIDGSGDAEEVSFSLDGVSYDIDLSPANREALAAALEPFIAAGRRRRGGRAKRRATTRGAA